MDAQMLTNASEEHRPMTGDCFVNPIRSLWVTAAALVLLFASTGCRGGGSGGGEVDMLKRAAGKIASSEMAKFNALELQDKDKVVFSSIGTILPEMDYGTGIYMKRYRKFTRYELKDIVKSDSMVAPYILVIDYTYDFMMTPPKAAKSPTDKAAEDAAAKETEFAPTTEHLVRRYHCDPNGNFVGKISDLPPPENFYSHGGVPPETSVLLPK
jgi:hypothetical protein